MGVSLGYHHGEREGGAAKAGQAEADVFIFLQYSLGSGVTWASTLGMQTTQPMTQQLLTTNIQVHIL